MSTPLELRTRARHLWLETTESAADNFAVWVKRNWGARMALALADAFERDGDAIDDAQMPLPLFSTRGRYRRLIENDKDR